MHRDLCLCLTCLSRLSQPEHREILTTSCQSCGKTLIARAHPGYQYCATCSTNENCCMSCGGRRSTPSEQLALQLIRKLLETDPALTWAYEPQESVVVFEGCELIGQMILPPNEGGKEGNLQLCLALPSKAQRMSFCVYQKQIIHLTEAIHDLEFLKTHVKEVQQLAQNGCLYQSATCGFNYERWFWETHQKLLTHA